MDALRLARPGMGPHFLSLGRRGNRSGAGSLQKDGQMESMKWMAAGPVKGLNLTLQETGKTAALTLD